MENTINKKSFFKRLISMLKVDAFRIVKSPIFYIMVGISFVVPILILVMTTMMDGTISTDPNGNQTVIEGFKNVWQIFGSVTPTGEMAGGGMNMDIVSMCNINMMYFAIAVIVCVFVCEDFRSGYAKNLFTVRAKKTDYVISKTIICSFAGACMILAFSIGAIFGGAISNLPFTMEGFNVYNLICSIISKVLLVPIFTSIFLTMSVIAKQKTWLAVCLSLGVGMFLFMVISIASPLDATIIHIILCIAGSAMFSIGLGAVSNLVLRKTSLV